MICGHIIKTEGAFKACEEATSTGKDCGYIMEVCHSGEGSRRKPCDDCIANKVWVKIQEKWTEASELK